jgi:serine/threonine-protein kinase
LVRGLNDDDRSLMGDDALKEGTVLSDSYRVVRRIGRGGMGEVYEALHQRTGAPFAIKVLAEGIGSDEGVLERFQREAEVTSRLRHPNIVKVFDFNRLPDGRPFLAMELLSGKDLAALAADEGLPLPVARVADIVDQISLALFAAHEAGVVHRDLKPANIFIERLPGSDRDLVRVLDFGISKLRNAPGALTKTTAIIGTPHYMSPEQATGRSKNIDGRSDQFSLATIAYEMLAGRRAFAAVTDDEEGDAAMAIIFRVVHQEPPAWSSLGVALPEALEKVVLRAMAKSPDDRFPDIRAFGAAFVAAAAATAGAGAAAAPARGPASRLSAARTEVLPAEPPRPSTTLGLASGETRLLPTTETGGRPAPSRRPAMLAVLVAVPAVAVVVVVAVVLKSSPTSPQPAPGAAPIAAPAAVAAPAVTAPPPATAPPAATPPAPPASIAVAVEQPPDGLSVWEGDRALALPLALPADGGTHHLVFKAPGRRDLGVDVVARPGASVSLAAMQAGKPAAPDRAAHRPKHHPAPGSVHNEDI